MARRADSLIPSRWVGALDIDTEVPTPSGMTTLENLAVGASVFGSNGEPATVVEISEPMHGLRCFEVEFATGDRFVADEDQRWLTERRDVRRPTAVGIRRGTRELAGSVAEHGPTALGVRVAPAVRLPIRRLPIDPYVLGAWLGAGQEHAAALVGISEELVRRLRDRGARIFVSGLPGQHWLAVQEVQRGADLVSRLTRLRVIGDKHVPMTYLRASEDQRRAMLAGLLDSAGQVTDGGEVVLRAVTPDLAIGVHQLAASLGYRPWLRPNPQHGADVGFVTGDRVFGVKTMQALHQARRRLAAELRPRRLVVAVREVRTRPLRRLRIATDDGVVLLGRSFIPVPGATPEPVAQISSPA